MLFADAGAGSNYVDIKTDVDSIDQRQRPN